MPSVSTPNRTFIIAEAGVNHNGDPALAHTLVEAAAGSGADAVKFQLFDPEEIVSAVAPLAAYQEKSGEDNQQKMLGRLVLPLETYGELKRHAEEVGLQFIVTPFDSASAQFLYDLGVSTFKIPSGEITNLHFLQNVAAFHLFTIISTGMSSMEEVRAAVDIFKNAGTSFALLHCVSSYPAPHDQINLRAMDMLRRTFDVPVGFSDHTEGTDVALAAAARGAAIIEKHFTLSRSMTGPDHAASLEVPELTAMIRSIRTIEQALGKEEKQCQPCEENVRSMARRSVVLTQDVPKGTTLTADMLTIKRPGTGIAPALIATAVGKTARQNLQAGAPLTDGDLQ